MDGGAKQYGFVHGHGGFHVGEDNGGGAIGDRRAIGALQRARYEWIFFGLVAAEIIAQVFLEMGQFVDRSVGVVLGGDLRQRIGLVAIFLEIAIGDAGEDIDKRAVLAAFFFVVGGFGQNLADGGAGQLGHFFDADAQNDARLARRDGVEALVYGGGAGGAGVFDASGRLEAKIGMRLQHQRGGEILRNEAAAEMADEYFVHIGGRHAGVFHSVDGGVRDQRFQLDAFMFAEFRMGPAHHATAHENCSFQVNVWRALWNKISIWCDIIYILIRYGFVWIGMDW